MYLIGYDVGSSSVKVALVEAETKRAVAVAHYPDKEMAILSPRPDWAEQDPEDWWKNAVAGTRKVLEQAQVKPSEIRAIGISYQMHGLVLVDKKQQVLRPSIIWCDSRAVDIGHQSFSRLGSQKCLSHLLNSPGNFTASKLRWVKENEPQIFQKVKHFMLPGDFMAMKMTGEAATTVSGLSEGIFWDFKEERLADFLLTDLGLPADQIPSIVETLSIQGVLTVAAATELGLEAGTPVSYRAGDQPNNAMSLDVLEPGEVAATGGTSGVVYGVVDQPVFDSQSRVNGFAHVNHTPQLPRIGVLLCINGAGIQYSWIRHEVAGSQWNYDQLEKLASGVPVGSEDLRVISFGNGAERILENKNIGSSILGLQFNRHKQAHMVRAALEGVAFSFVYGMGILEEMGSEMKVMRVGNDNLFRSAIFSSTISALTGANIQLMETTGAVGAAKAAGVAVGAYSSLREAMKGNKLVGEYQVTDTAGEYREAYEKWKNDLVHILNNKQ